MENFSVVCLISSFSAWLTFVFGTVLNLALLRLTIKHTPKQMQMYSKILIQTIICDMVVLVLTILTEPIKFETADAGSATYLNGIVRVQKPEFKVLGTFLFSAWIFVICMSLFGFTAQFIYRYLALNRNVHLSISKYLSMVGFIAVLMLAYCVLFGIVSYPSETQQFLSDVNVAQMLGLNISRSPVLLASYFYNNDCVLKYANFAMFTFDLISYAIICTTGYLMHKMVAKRPSGHGITNLQQEKIKELNRQMNKALIIQALVPLAVYVPSFAVLFTLLILPSANGELVQKQQQAQQNYFSMLQLVPMYFPSALNPAVAICTIKAYRKAFVDELHRVVKKLIL